MKSLRKLFRRRPKKLNVEHFSERWQAVQKQCVSRKTWPQAIMDADKLLDDALKRSRYKGKTVGERLVAAQHTLTSNETVWFGHKFCKTLNDTDVRTLKKKDIIDALSGFRQALRDLGALDK